MLSLILWVVEEEQDASDLGDSQGQVAASKVSILLHSLLLCSANLQGAPTTLQAGCGYLVALWPPH